MNAVFINVLRLRLFLLVFVSGSCFASLYKNPSVEHGFTQVLLSERTPGAHGATISFSFAKASSSYDEYGQTVPLFGCFGPSDFYQLVKLHKTFADSSLTSAFIQEVCAKGNGATPSVSTGPMYSRQDQLLHVDGKISMSRMQLDGFVDLKNGFAVSVQIPIIVTNCEDLRFVSTSGAKTEFSDLVNSRINPVLEENGIEPLYKNQNVCSIGDAKVGLIWSEQFPTDASWAKVKNVSLGIGGFVLLPTSIPQGYQKQFLYSLPVGDNGSFGVGMRADAVIDLKDNFSLMFSAENKVFFQQNFLMRAKLFAAQSGLLLNEPVHLWFDNGSTWKVFAGAKCEIPKLRSNFFAGYYYDSKEVTQLTMSDQEYSKNTIFDLVAEKPTSGPLNRLNQIYYGQNPPPLTPPPPLNPGVGFQNEVNSPTKLQGSVLNSDRAFARQYAHWVCLGMSLERRRLGIGCSSQDLVIAFNFAYPIFGKNRFILNTLSGCVGASARLEF